MSRLCHIFENVPNCEEVHTIKIAENLLYRHTKKTLTSN